MEARNKTLDYISSATRYMTTGYINQISLSIMYTHTYTNIRTTRQHSAIIYLYFAVSVQARCFPFFFGWFFDSFSRASLVLSSALLSVLFSFLGLHSLAVCTVFFQFLSFSLSLSPAYTAYYWYCHDTFSVVPTSIFLATCSDFFWTLIVPVAPPPPRFSSPQFFPRNSRPRRTIFDTVKSHGFIYKFTILTIVSFSLSLRRECFLHFLVLKILATSKRRQADKWRKDIKIIESAVSQDIVE